MASSPATPAITNSAHFCALQPNIGTEACCQLVRLLNVPERVPFCSPQVSFLPTQTAHPNSTTASPIFVSTLPPAKFSADAENHSATHVSAIFHRSYPKFGAQPAPAMNLKVPPDEVPEEHLTFLFGVFMLISMAVICTLFLMKLAKAGNPESTASAHFHRNARCLGDLLPDAAADYSLMLWLPGGRGGGGSRGSSGSNAQSRATSARPISSRHHRRSTAAGPSLFLLLRSSFRRHCGPTEEGDDDAETVSTAADGGGCSARSDRSGSSTAELLPAIVVGSGGGGGGRFLPRGGGSTGRRPPYYRTALPRSERSCISIVSSSSMNPLLQNMTPSPSSGSAGLAAAALNSSSSPPMSAVPPPPCYEELEEYAKER